MRRLGVDAAVMFADIMLPLQGMGVDFQLVENVGPVIAHPIATPADVERLGVPDGEEAAPQVIAAVRQVVAESPVPVIGFSGAPFTLASYLIEGRPSRDFARVKAFMFTEPQAFELFLLIFEFADDSFIGRDSERVVIVSKAWFLLIGFRQCLFQIADDEERNNKRGDQQHQERAKLYDERIF